MSLACPPVHRAASRARLRLDLEDPDGDGKVRFREVKSRLTNPLCLFNSSGSIEAYARVKIETPFGDAPRPGRPVCALPVPRHPGLVQLDRGGGGWFELPVPVLARTVGTDLYLNVGPQAGLRKFGGDGSEVYQVTDLGDGRVQVTGFGYTQIYGSTTNKIRSINGDFGAGNDELSVSHAVDGANETLIRVVVQADPATTPPAAAPPTTRSSATPATTRSTAAAATTPCSAAPTTT
ncbi:MAG: hypothetical protein R2697_12550 [Ilumatobacteraceae bacterium]